jgi:hypothetical protein
LGFQEMLKGAVRKAALMGGLLVLLLVTIIGAVVIYILITPNLMALLELVITLAIVGFLSGFLTVRTIMGQMLKQFMPLIEELTNPKKK